MDRTLVCTQNEEYQLDQQLSALFNIPFEAIPRGFIEQLKPRSFTYEEFLQRAPVMNSLNRVYWNIVIIDQNDAILAVMWGTMNLLESCLIITRLSVHPSVQQASGRFMHYYYQLVKDFAKSQGLSFIYFFTSKSGSFLRKLLPNTLKLTQARLLEVI